MSLITENPIISAATPPGGIDTNPFVEGTFNATWDLLDIANITQSGTFLNNDSGNIPSKFIVYESTIIRHDKPITNVCKFLSINDTVTGDSDVLKFFKQYRYSNDNINWSGWFNFSVTPSDWNSLDDLYVEFQYTCVPVDPNNPDNNALVSKSLILSSVVIQGQTELTRTNLVASLDKIGQCIVICPQDVWKVWQLSNYEITAGGLTPNRTLNVSFRISTTSKREWTPWLPLNVECLSKVKFDPLRFFYIEVNLCRAGSDPTGVIKIYDIVFSGNFQNVSADYKKFNRFGMRTDCRTSYNLDDCDPNAIQYPPKEWSDPNNCGDNKECNTGTFNPYNQGIIPFYNHLANQISNLFGWEVDYYRTDPDQNGIDRVMHQYTLFNTVDVQKVKIIVDKNKFPENQLLPNQFNLELFDTFQVSITRDAFKNAFGITERPGKWDYLFFCEWNRLYQVTHSLANKDFMNSSVYYILTLKKADNNKHVRKTDPVAPLQVPQADGSTKTAEQMITDLTTNSSLDTLFGEENRQETLRIADKPQLKTLAHEDIRRTINPYVRNIEAPFENGPNILSKNYYDLSNVAVTDAAITYNYADNLMQQCDDRTFIVWFNLKTLRANMQYNLLTNQAIINGAPNGYRFNYQDRRFDIEWGSQFLEIPFTQAETNVWYCFVLRMHQTVQKWELKIFRRQSDINPRSYTTTQLKLVTQDSGDLLATQFDIGETPITIQGSEMLLTNVRIFADLIAETSLMNVLNQYIIRDSQTLILADNAEPKFVLKNFNFRPKEVDKFT